MGRTRKHRRYSRGQRGSGILNAITGIFKKKPTAPNAQTGFLPAPGGNLLPLNQYLPSGNFAPSTVSTENAVIVNQRRPQGMLSVVTIPPAAAASPVAVPVSPAAATNTQQRDRIVREFIGILDVVGFNNSNVNILIESVLNSLSFDETIQNSRVDTFPIVEFIPDFTLSNFNRNLGSVITQGGFGTIYNHKTNPNRIIKSVKFNVDFEQQLINAGLPADRGNVHNFLKNSLRETFIQFYLSSLEPTIVPRVFKIAKDDSDINNTLFFIEMERLNAPFVDLYDYMQEEFYMDWNRFKEIIIAVCNALIRLEEAAHFVHRDFKPNNVMINPETLEIKIIDFGYSTIEIPGYRIINYFPSFLPEAPSRYQQDMGMFFIFIRELLIDSDIFTDTTIARFIRFIIPASIYGVRRFINAYNAAGNVFNNANTERLLPQNVLDAIETFDTPVTFGGKRRSRYRKKTKKLTKRRT